MEKYIEQKTEKIDDLNLIALRKYACPKINAQKDWFLKCVDCKGLSGCPAGKRALQIIEEQTKPVEKKAEGLSFPLSPQELALLRVGIRDRRSLIFIDAMGTKDPVDYLVKKGHSDKRWRANDALRKFCINHKLITSSESLPNYNASHIDSRENAIKRIKDLLSKYRTPEELAKNVSVSFATIYDWTKKYAKEIGPDKELMLDAARIIQHNDYLKRKNKEAPMEKSTDEVSIQDFLKESDQEVGKVCNEATKKVEKTAMDDIPVTPVQRKEGAPKPVPVISCSTIPVHSNNQEILLAEFTKKRHEYKKQIKVIELQIGELELSKKWLQERMDILDKSAKLFGMKPID